MDNLQKQLKEISITTSRLELRIPTNQEIKVLGSLLSEGIQNFGEPHFQDEKLYKNTSDEAEQVLKEIILEDLKKWEKEEWNLPFAIFYDNKPIGLITMYAKNFPIAKGFGASYWIGLPYQGQGFGTETLQGVLAFGFDVLDAREAYCGAWSDNIASLRMMEKLKFIFNGEYWMVRQGKAVKDKRMRLPKEKWIQPETFQVTHFDVGLFL